MLLRVQRQLIEAGVVTREQVEQAVRAANGKGKLLPALLKVDGVDAKKLIQALASIYKIPYLDVATLTPPARLLERCGEQFCRDQLFLPMDEKEDHVVAAMADPMDFSALDAIRFKLGKKVRPLFAHPDQLRRRIQELFQGDDFDAAMEGVDEAEVEGAETGDAPREAANLDELKRGAEESPVIKLVNGILIKALKMGASDVHVEPAEGKSVVRFRLDGRLHPAMQFPSRVHAHVASRIKILARLDISNTRTPQDGRTRIKVWDRHFDLRVSTLPSMHGEKVVLRILDKSGLSLSLDALGFEQKADARVRECIQRSSGAVLVTGPTGSGKTTTLYSFLNAINDHETNIITVEDPVEFQIKGLNQVQVNPAAGMTFAAALRSILRQDPDVVMVGEIRDEETAEIAMHAAQTGHLVFSTLHTNDAPSTVTRLLDMGIEPTTLASALNLVVAQRLARRLCPACKQPASPPPEMAERLGMPEDVDLYGPKGCSRCNGIGYKGRIGVHEVLYVSEQMRELIGRGAGDRELLKLAREQGMFTLFEDALDKALQGITSLDEVLRIGAPPEDFVLCDRLRDGRIVPLGEANEMRRQARRGGASDDDAAHVLIVDDSSSVRSLVRFVLSSEGFTVDECENGQDAWHYLAGRIPDLVITDYEMPNMTGPELVEKIRTHAEFDSMPVIMLTSRREEEDEVLGLETGADDYILKPVEPLKLQARVKKVLGMYRRIRQAMQQGGGDG